MEQLEVKAVAEHAGEVAARSAIRETFRLFGVDVEDQDQVNAFRADLIHARKLRKLSEQSGAIAAKVVITAAVAGALALLWDSFKHVIGPR